MGFWDEEFCVVTSVFEVCYDSSCDFTGVGCFKEFAVGAAFAGGVKAVAVVDEDEHKNRELVVSRFPMRIYEKLSEMGQDVFVALFFVESSFGCY